MKGNRWGVSLDGLCITYKDVALKRMYTRGYLDNGYWQQGYYIAKQGSVIKIIHFQNFPLYG